MNEMHTRTVTCALYKTVARVGLNTLVRACAASNVSEFMSVCLQIKFRPLQK